ncbi:hypothetical protein C7M84_017581 [Penaeus vannamei]|uniref:Uncharacterized protein n=1 Tax=Penaeus vannamei TaxID=6689 RepID=A0A423SK04_PENVA|nr:hypothetical protein C7M84_017581 [Penaeus vannamei]
MHMVSTLFIFLLLLLHSSFILHSLPPRHSLSYFSSLSSKFSFILHSLPPHHSLSYFFPSPSLFINFPLSPFSFILSYFFLSPSFFIPFPFSLSSHSLSYPSLLLIQIFTHPPSYFFLSHSIFTHPPLSPSLSLLILLLSLSFNQSSLILHAVPPLPSFLPDSSHLLYVRQSSSSTLFLLFPPSFRFLPSPLRAAIFILHALPLFPPSFLPDSSHLLYVRQSSSSTLFLLFPPSRFLPSPLRAAIFILHALPPLSSFLPSRFLPSPLRAAIFILHALPPLPSFLPDSSHLLYVRQSSSSTLFLLFLPSFPIPPISFTCGNLSSSTLFPSSLLLISSSPLRAAFPLFRFLPSPLRAAIALPPLPSFLPERAAIFILHALPPLPSFLPDSSHLLTALSLLFPPSFRFLPLLYAAIALLFPPSFLPDSSHLLYVSHRLLTQRTGNPEIVMVR